MSEDMGPNGCTCGYNGDCNCPFVPSAASDATALAKAARFTWTRQRPGLYTAHGYSIERRGEGWAILRDGQFWDRARTLPIAKQSCERDRAAKLRTRESEGRRG